LRLRLSASMSSMWSRSRLIAISHEADRIAGWYCHVSRWARRGR
jgi:hypothetical protein